MILRSRHKSVLNILVLYFIVGTLSLLFRFLFTSLSEAGDASNKSDLQNVANRHSRDGVLVVTWADSSHSEFVFNWVDRARESMMTNFVVGALDEPLHSLLMEQGVPTFDASVVFPLEHKMLTAQIIGRARARLAALWAGIDVNVILCDVDAIWLRDPTRLFDENPAYDLMVASDQLVSTAEGDFEVAADSLSDANPGVLLMRRGKLELFAQEWDQALREDGYALDGEVFSKILSRGVVFNTNTPRRFLAFDQTLRVGILSVSLVSNGHTYFLQKLHEKSGVKPYAVHATHQFSGLSGKKHRFREAGLWCDKPGYYAPEKKIISINLNLPPEITASSNSVAGHFRLVNHQLKQIRGALAAAEQLNRTLLLPPILCGKDRTWTPRGQEMLESALPSPFTCPLDHVFDVEYLLRHFDVRESGFNFKTQIDQVNASSMKYFQTTDGLSSEVAHVHVRNSDDTFMTEKVAQKINKTTSFWCCMRHDPGSVWYDAFWDVEPHVDRHGRHWESWSPLPGP